MKAFWTLMKTEYRDHVGGALWMPLIVASLVTLALLVTAFSAFSGEGRLVVDDKGIRITGIDQGAAYFEIQSDAEIKTLPDGSVEKTETTVKKEKGVLVITKKITTTKDGQEQVSTTTRTLDAQEGLPLAEGAFNKDKTSQVSVVVLAVSILPVLGITLFASYFMMISALHSERADRSILFWKSMPVSDGAVVAAKALGNTLLPIASALSIGCIAFLANALILSITLVSQTDGLPLGIFWSVGKIFLSLLTIVSFVLCYLIWAAPLYGWMLLASALAPRSPFLVASVPLVVVVVLEALFLKTSWFGGELVGRFFGGYIIDHFNQNVAQGSYENTIKLLSSAADAPLVLFSSLASLGSLLGLVCAGGLVFAAILIRQRKAL